MHAQLAANNIKVLHKKKLPSGAEALYCACSTGPFLTSFSLASFSLTSFSRTFAQVLAQNLCRKRLGRFTARAGLGFRV